VAIQLRIDDGEPWYLSPDIWVVPGDDPDGAPGQPSAGQPAFVWARVYNQGSTPVDDGRVTFYWAVPTSAISRQSAHLVGTSGVALAAGEAKEVLCLSQWTPQMLNGGHLCLMVEVSSPGDPLPPHMSTTPFDPVGDRHVAQRNVTVIDVQPDVQFAFLPFLAGQGADGETTVRARRFPLGALGDLIRDQLGLGAIEEADLDAPIALRPYRPGVPVQLGGEPELTLRGPSALTLVVGLDGRLRPGTAVLVVAEEQDARGRERGGVAMVVVGAEEDGEHG
jgi:hypothetical protein